MANSNLDYVLMALGDAYSDRIPNATQTNLADVGSAILAYEPAKNAFLSALYNKIALTLISSVEFDNPFAQFKGPNINYGDTVEDIYVDLADGYAYDATNTNPFGQVTPDVQALYHTINVQLQYKITIRDAQLRQAFRTPNGFDELVTSIVSSLRTSADYDEYLMTMKVMSTESIVGATKYLGVATGTDATDGKALLKAIKEAGSAMKHMSSAYNALGVNTKTDLSKQVLIITSKYKDIIDLDVLAGLYNMSKAEISQRIIEVESFVDDDALVAMLVDERGFRINQALVDGGMIYNPQGLYTNHFLNNWEVISWALFRNAIAIKFEAEPEDDDDDDDENGVVA